MSGDLGMLGRVVGGLIVVLVVMALIARVARRANGENGGSGLRIIERIGLSREANLAVIEISDRKLLLGVTAQGVTMLADLEGAPEAGEQVAAIERAHRGGSRRPAAGAVVAFVVAKVRDSLGFRSKPEDGETGRPEGRRAARAAGSSGSSGPSGSSGSARHGRRRADVPAQAHSQAQTWADTEDEDETADEADVPTEDAARELAMSFAQESAAQEAAPVDALIVDVRETPPSPAAPTLPAASTLPAAPAAPVARPSGRRAARPPADKPRSRAENRASLRETPADAETTPLPGGLNVTEYPDLASALRAAGRTSAEPQPQAPIAPVTASAAPAAPAAQVAAEPISPAAKLVQASERRSARKSFVPDSPAALFQTPAPTPAPNSAPAPVPAPRPAPVSRPRAEMRAAREDSLSERTARQVAAFQAEAYPEAVRSGSVVTGRRAAEILPEQPGRRMPRRAAAQGQATPQRSAAPARPAGSARPGRAQPQVRTRAEAQGRVPASSANQAVPAQPTGRRSQQQDPQVNGSVLSPRTWRQGVDALRDMTVRRG